MDETALALGGKPISEATLLELVVDFVPSSVSNNEHAIWRSLSFIGLSSSILSEGSSLIK
jgi:hypothetical protein